MPSIQSSFFLYKATHEWKISEPRDFLEIGRSSSFYKNSPEIEFTVLKRNGERSCPIYWYVYVYSGTQIEDGKPVYEVQIQTNTKGNSIGISIGLKLSLTILDDCSNILYENRSYKALSSSSSINTYVSSWYHKLEDIPRDCPFMKIYCTYQAYDISTGFIPAQTDPAQLLISAPSKDAEGELAKELVHVLDKDRQTGTSTDAVLKLGQTEYKVHKCVLSLQSDFFKARFSERWEARDTDTRVVDMNDSELSPELLEALISGAYTGKVEGLDTAVKILPVADKYQFHTLKGVCERLICSQLTKENVLPVYLMATQCRALELQKKCEAVVKI